MFEILTTIASLASIASLAIQVGVPLRSDGTADISAVIGNLQQRLTLSQQVVLNTPGAQELIELLIIDPDLLDDLKKNIERCISEYRRAINASSKRTDHDVADKKAERCVCDNLNRLKRRNDGVLPPGKFSDWWVSYRCADDFDY